MNNEIIVVKQLPQIEEHLQTIKTQVTEKVNAALSLICTEDTIKSVKAVRADLNKDLKEFEERRKAVKKAIMTPYEAFESVYKDCISDTYKKADVELKAKIDSVENELKVQKTAEVKGYFDEYRDSKIANGITWIGFANANINVTLSASMKSLKEQAKSFIDRICDDLSLIDTQEHKDEILYEYKQSLNVSSAITTVANRYKAIEAAKAEEEERKAREQAEAEAAAKVEKVVETLTPPTAEPIAPPVEKEPVLTVSFKVSGTRAELKKLKEFLTVNNYKYE